MLYYILKETDLRKTANKQLFSDAYCLNSHDPRRTEKLYKRKRKYSITPFKLANKGIN